MILLINGLLVEPTDFRPGPDDSLYYNMEVKHLTSSLKLRFNHTQFRKENPEWATTLKRLYDEAL